jgi:hypothetical protein
MAAVATAALLVGASAGAISHRLRLRTPPGDDSGEAAAGSVTAALAEFQALRAEIQLHLGSEARLVALNLTATAAISAAVIQYRASGLLLLIVPPLSMALGFSWLGHRIALYVLGAYVRDELWPFVQSRLRSPLPSWEERWCGRRGVLHNRLVLNASEPALFIAPAALALVVSFASVRSRELLAVWFAEAVFCVAVVAYAAVTTIREAGAMNRRLPPGRAPPAASGRGRSRGRYSSSRPHSP